MPFAANIVVLDVAHVANGSEGPQKTGPHQGLAATAHVVLNP
jgi:hypothetical protein